MKLNPADVKEGESVFDTFPVFLKIKEFKGGIGAIEESKILLYLLYAYSKDSEIVRTLSDPVEIKDEAAAKVGWKKVKGSYPETVSKIINNELPEIRQRIVRIFKLQNNLEFSAYRSELEAFYQNLAELISPPPSSEDDDERLKALNLKAVAAKNKEDMLTRISKRRTEMFNGNTELEEIVQDNDLGESDFGEGIVEQMAKKYKPTN